MQDLFDPTVWVVSVCLCVGAMGRCGRWGDGMVEERAIGALITRLHGDTSHTSDPVLVRSADGARFWTNTRAVMLAACLRNVV